MILWSTTSTLRSQQKQYLFANSHAPKRQVPMEAGSLQKTQKLNTN